MLKNKLSKRLNNLLVIHDDNVEHVRLSLLFENNGFPVTASKQGLTPDSFDNFGAIAHIGRSKPLLDKRLAEQLEKIRDEEWILIAGDDENDLHCTIELTQKASQELRVFVRSLWSMFSMS